MTANCMQSFPCLTIRQPWASLIIYHGKDIENRTWKTSYRGPMLIHASAKLTKSDIEEASVVMDSTRKWPAIDRYMILEDMREEPRGGIVGIVELVDIVTESTSPWFVGPFGWVLANPRPLPFRALRGQLGLWKAAVDGLPLYEGGTKQ